MAKVGRVNLDEVFADEALSPLDGRYKRDVASLRKVFSEAALQYRRAKVEVEYFIALMKALDNPLKPSMVRKLRDLIHDYKKEYIKEIEEEDQKVNHDVTAVVNWLKKKLVELGLGEYVELVHWGLTSEDVTNLAYALSVQDGWMILMSEVERFRLGVHDLRLQEAGTPMLSRTHGQPATPTTLGKELAVFDDRIHRAIWSVFGVKLTAKLNGATGTYAGHMIGAPQINWDDFSRKFVKSLGFLHRQLTTQVEPNDALVELLDGMKRLNMIGADMCEAIWYYVSLDYFVQIAIAGEVGSSTMPNKVNPIDWENGEGNLWLAVGNIMGMGIKLQRSRMQRDLSNSTVLRSVGTIFGHTLLAFKRMNKGLRKLQANRQRLDEDLGAHPEVLAEAIQLVLRMEGVSEGHKKLAALTRGRKTPITLSELYEFIESQSIGSEARARLLALTPQSYIGAAEMLALGRKLS